MNRPSHQGSAGSRLTRHDRAPALRLTPPSRCRPGPWAADRGPEEFARFLLCPPGSAFRLAIDANRRIQPAPAAADNDSSPGVSRRARYGRREDLDDIPPFVTISGQRRSSHSGWMVDRPYPSGIGEPPRRGAAFVQRVGGM